MRRIRRAWRLGPVAVAGRKRASVKPEAEALKTTHTVVVDAAGVSAGLWISYLFALFYLFVAAAAVTHRDLFLENPVRLPFLNVDLPLKSFFWLGPLLFLIVHAYVMLHFVIFAGKISVFDEHLRTALADDPDERTRRRQQLPNNIFVQFLAGPQEVRKGTVGFLLKLIAWISLVIGPVALLAFFQLQFLPYHHEWITWWQRIAVLIDVFLLWRLWPAIVRGEAESPARRGIRWGTLGGMACLSLVCTLLVIVIATFPGEWLDAQLEGHRSEWLQQALVAGKVNSDTRNRESLWSNTLVLPGFDVIDHVKFDEKKLAELPEIASFRARHLEGAVLSGAGLRKTDFTAAHLQGALLDHAQLDGASLYGTELQGASLFYTKLRGALLSGARLQGAVLFRTDLRGALFIMTHLQGATVADAQLKGVSFFLAELEGAMLVDAKLQGALLVSAQLQGASLIGAQLQGASLNGAIVWRAIPPASSAGAAVKIAKTRVPCEASSESCVWNAESYAALKQLIALSVPQGPNRDNALQTIEARLDPGKPVNDEADDAKAWSELERTSVPPAAYEVELARQWHEIGCAADGAPYVLTGLARNFFDPSAYEPFPFAPSVPDSLQFRKLAADFLDSETCPGARGLSSDTIAIFKRFRDRRQPPSPQ